MNPFVERMFELFTGIDESVRLLALEPIADVKFRLGRKEFVDGSDSPCPAMAAYLSVERMAVAEAKYRFELPSPVGSDTRNDVISAIALSLGMPDHAIREIILLWDDTKFQKADRDEFRRMIHEYCIDAQFALILNDVPEQELQEQICKEFEPSEDEFALMTP